jgi:hypothetical protein
MMYQGDLKMAGAVSLKADLAGRPSLAWKLRNSLRPSFIWGQLTTGAARAFSQLTGVPTMTGQLEILHLRANGQRVYYGVVSRRVVTTAFVNFVTDQLQTETSVFGDFKYHDAGVGTTAENIADTAIETTDGESRATGTQTESAANAYRSVGTISYTSTKAITEHGLFNDSSAGTLMDRSVFSAINVVSGDSIQFTYTLTISSGG